MLAAGKIDLWDSGKVASDETIGIVYAGEKLGSRDRCHWRVRVWDQDGEPSAWSEPALWTMGLLEPSDWQAKWIGDPAPAPPDSPPHRGYRSEPDEKGEQPKWVAIDLGQETAIDGVRLYGTRIVERGVGDVPGYLYPLRYRIEVASQSGLFRCEGGRRQRFAGCSESRLSAHNLPAFRGPKHASCVSG